VAVYEPEPTGRHELEARVGPCGWDASASGLPSLSLCVSFYPPLVNTYHILRNCGVHLGSCWRHFNGSKNCCVAFNCIHSLSCNVRRASIRIFTARLIARQRVPGFPDTCWHPYCKACLKYALIRRASCVSKSEKKHKSWENEKRHLAHQLGSKSNVKGGSWFHSARSMKTKTCVLAFKVLAHGTKRSWFTLHQQNF